MIFDFDGTLCSELYFHALGQRALSAITELVFAKNSKRWAEPWMKGELSGHDIAFYLSEHLPYSPETILSALHRGCSKMTFNSVVFEFAVYQRKSQRKTALVTANMDIFSTVVVPAHGLKATFDVILNTAEYGTLDKSVLWNRALTAFGPEYSFATCLLIEDGRDNVELFRRLGGSAYQYKGEEPFRSWLAATFGHKLRSTTARTV